MAKLTARARSRTPTKQARPDHASPLEDAAHAEAAEALAPKSHAADETSTPTMESIIARARAKLGDRK